MKWKLHLPIFLSIFFLFFYYISSYKNIFYIEYDIKIIQNDNSYLGELFYSDNASYNPQNRRLIRYIKHNQTFEHITEKIRNMKTIHKVRLDPLLGAGRVEVKNFTIHYINPRYQDIDKKYQVDFSKISNNYMNNLEIISTNKSGAILESTGNDPFIELTHNINFNIFNIHNVLKALVLAILLYLFLIIIKIYSVVNVFSFGILLIYTSYVLLFDSNVMAFDLLITFTLVSFFMILSNNPSNLFIYLKHVGVFLLFYLLIGYTSLFITTEVAYENYFYKTIPYIILALIIPMGFYNIKRFDIRYFKNILTILLIMMAIFILLLNQKIISIFYFHLYDIYYDFFDFYFKWTWWTQKNYTFWYVLLMFGTLSFYDIRKKVELIIISAILVLSYFAVFSGYSESAKLSYVIGVLIYILLSFFQIQKKNLLIITWLFTLYIILSPILFSLIDPSLYPKLESRVAVYKTAFALIKEHWLFGYGYGSTLVINIKDFVTISDLPKYYIDTFPGGHPHNLALLFWLEFGIIGAIFLAYYIHKLLVYIIENTYNYTNQAAILSLVVAFDIITSFSWSIWWPSVLLTFSFFGVILVLSMNIKENQK